MACLGSVLYDPGTLATASTASLLAMTALDTTNARITFTAPANGNVLVRIRVPNKGSTNVPALLLGVLDGATVRGRQTPISIRQGITTTMLVQHEVAYLVTGLTPGNSFTWDAAYGVQVVVASTQLGWGGPNDTTTSNAYGALSYEIWDTANLLAGTMYDPGTANTANLGSALLALTAIDTTNLRLSFTVPASGRVLVRLRVPIVGGTSGACPAIHLGCLEGATLRGRTAAYTAVNDVNTTTPQVAQAEYVVSGLTPAANLTWDAAYAIETVGSGTKLAYGGPNDASGVDAYGGFSFEIWKA